MGASLAKKLADVWMKLFEIVRFKNQGLVKSLDLIKMGIAKTANGE